jgi:hypothetical protein
MSDEKLSAAQDLPALLQAYHAPMQELLQRHGYCSPKPQTYRASCLLLRLESEDEDQTPDETRLRDRRFLEDFLALHKAIWLLHDWHKRYRDGIPTSIESALDSGVGDLFSNDILRMAADTMAIALEKGCTEGEAKAVAKQYNHTMDLEANEAVSNLEYTRLYELVAAYWRAPIKP